PPATLRAATAVPPLSGRINRTGFHTDDGSIFSSISGGASRVPLHLGYLVHPRKKPRRLGRSFMGDPQSGQVSRTSTAGTSFLGGGGISVLSFSFSSGGTGLVLRHLG